MSHFKNDSDIIEAIRDGGRQVEQAMQYLYNKTSMRMAVKRFVKNSKGNNEDAEDVFQDGIIALVKKIRSEAPDIHTNLRGYLFTTCKNIWLKESGKKPEKLPIDNENEDRAENGKTPEDLLAGAEQKAIIAELMNQLKEACRNVLTLWSLNYSMKKIAEKTGYSAVSYTHLTLPTNGCG